MKPFKQIFVITSLMLSCFASSSVAADEFELEIEGVNLSPKKRKRNAITEQDIYPDQALLDYDGGAKIQKSVEYQIQAESDDEIQSQSYLQEGIDLGEISNDEELSRGHVINSQEIFATIIDQLEKEIPQPQTPLPEDIDVEDITDDEDLNRGHKAIIQPLFAEIQEKPDDEGQLQPHLQGIIEAEAITHYPGPKKWYGVSAQPSSLTIERAEMLQRFLLPFYNRKLNMVIADPKMLRDMAKKKFMKEQGWGECVFRSAYSVACQYGTQEEHNIFQKFVVGGNSGKKKSTFKIDMNLWHGHSKKISYGANVFKKAEKLKEYLLTFYDPSTDSLKGKPKEIHDQAREKFTAEYGWSKVVFTKAYSVACRYGIEKEYKIFKKFALKN